MGSVLDGVKVKESYLAGVSAPMNYFDPLGFSTTVDSGKLLFYREVELKHGRVAMLAALGFVVGEQYHPLFGGDIDVPSYLAFQQTPLEKFWPAVVAAIAIPEIFSDQRAQQWPPRHDCNGWHGCPRDSNWPEALLDDLYETLDSPDSLPVVLSVAHHS